MFIRYLFCRVKDMAVENTTNQAGHTITKHKIGANWPGMPTDLPELARWALVSMAVPEQLLDGEHPGCALPRLHGVAIRRGGAVAREPQ